MIADLPPVIQAPPPQLPAAIGAMPPAAAPATAASPAPRRHAPGDPLEKFNRHMFAIHQTLDRAVLRPAAMGYKHVVPSPVRGGVRHFFSNLGEPIVFLNFVLQVKLRSAVRTAARFFINSTVGVAGLIDVAKSRAVELPHVPNGFGDTLGYYGVKSGPYLFLPLVGPTDIRDFLGGNADGLVLPVAVGKPFDRAEYIVPRAVLTGLDERAESDADLKALLGDALDPYATLRSVYLQDRAGEIAALKGAPAGAALPGDEADPAAAGASSSASPELQPPLADPGGKAAPPAPELQDPLTDPAATDPAAPAAAAAAPAGPARR